ncbi:hypothetical protein DMI65_21055 [Escherichia coli]|nr:hypothetical protein [Escherichia coli]
MKQLAATTTITQLTLTASLIGLGVGQLLFGPLSDKIGRKTSVNLVVAIVYCFFHFVRDNEQYLLAGGLAFYSRDRWGAGGSVLSRSLLVTNIRVTLTQFFALLMTVNGPAPVLSPVLGGYIVSTFDWRTLFWVMAEISTVNCCWAACYLLMRPCQKIKGSSLLLTGRSVVQNRRFMRFA